MNSVFIPCSVEHHGERQLGKGIAAAAVYALSAASGGIVAAIALAALGETLRARDQTANDMLFTALVAALMLAAAVAQFTGRSQSLPQRRRQVPRRWLGWRTQTLTAAAYGFVLGAGAFTYLGHAVVFTVGLAAMAAPSLLAGAVIGLVYGASRGLVVPATWALRAVWKAPALEVRHANLILAAVGVLVPSALIVFHLP